MPSEAPSAPFAGFPPAALRFFRALARHQDRAWFAAHKTEYEQAVLGPLAALVAAVSAQLAAAGSPLRGDPKRSVFRIYRDVRFSADKSLYKTHAGVAITRDDDKLSPGVLYFHLDPAGSFAAAGFFRPEPAVLRRLREGLASRPAVWSQVERSLGTHSLVLLREDALARLPKDFESVSPDIDQALKLKSWIVRRDLAPSLLADAGLVDLLVGLAADARPLLEFGWSALDSA